MAIYERPRYRTQIEVKDGTVWVTVTNRETGQRVGWNNYTCFFNDLLGSNVTLSRRLKKARKWAAERIEIVSGREGNF